MVPMCPSSLVESVHSSMLIYLLCLFFPSIRPLRPRPFLPRALTRVSQATLDPEYGQAEVAGMKKEIHRMEFRLRQLKRKQEEMMQEMELAIEKREIIETKHSVAGAKSKTDTAATIKQKVCAFVSSIEVF